MKFNVTVEQFIASNVLWNSELNILREIILNVGLKETIKWGMPVYVHNIKNVVGIGAFKSYVGLWFYQGSLLSDPENKLINAQKGKTETMRQWRFIDSREIDQRLVSAYIVESMQHIESGREVKPSENNEFGIPDMLKKQLAKSSELKKVYDQLTTPKQSEYAEYVTNAKLVKTKIIRLDKITSMILADVGFA